MPVVFSQLEARHVLLLPLQRHELRRWDNRLKNEFFGYFSRAQLFRAQPYP